MRRLRTISTQLMTIVLICYLVPTLLLSWCMGAVILPALRQKAESALTTGVEHASALAAANVERAVTLAKDVTYDGELTLIYGSYRAGTLSAADLTRQSRAYIERKFSREALFTFTLYYPLDEPNLLIYNREGYAQAMAYLREANEQVLAMAETLKTKTLFYEQDGQIYLVRNLLDSQLKRFGLLVLGVDKARLLAPLMEVADAWDAQLTYLLDACGDPTLKSISDGFADPGKGDSVFCSQRASTRDFTLTFRLDVARDRLYGELRTFHLLIALLVLLFVPAMAIIMRYVHRRIIQPVTVLSKASKRIEAGELGVTVPARGEDELSELSRAFSGMSLQVQQLVDKTYKEEIALRDARIQAMQSRINPHFINNALETINWQAQLEGSQTITQMVDSLSVLLNAGMGRGDKRMVPLREETQVAQAYIFFLGLRFGERLTVNVHIGCDAEDVMIPLLTLQPLLENAAEHGIAPAGGGEIDLTCLREDAQLRIQVRNTGRGITPEDRSRIDAALHTDNVGGTHLGLNNIAARLRLIYGGRAQLDVTSQEDGCTLAQLTIPTEAYGA